jgi:plastocyanin
MSNNPDRRDILRAGGLLLAGSLTGFPAHAMEKIFDIEMRSNLEGSKVWFDPIALLVPRHSVIRWTTRQSVHTATAYHPNNDDHSLRIPENARAWDSGYLVNPGDSFSITLSEPGVYDYFCAPHELGGMVGRIIVEEPTGPGAKPFDYFKNKNPVPDWQEVPEMARAAFPSVTDILAQKIVRVTQE